MISYDKILCGPSPIYEPGPGGLGHEIFLNFKQKQGKICQKIIHTGESETYANLFEKSVQTAIYLKSKNLKSDDVVCLCSGNSLNSFVPFVASQFVGVTYSSIEPTMPEDDLIHLLNYFEPKILFVSENVEEKLVKCVRKTNVKTELVIFGKSKYRNENFEEILKLETDENFTPVYIEDLKRTAVIFLSSGTTGKPKGICCNHYGILGQTWNCINSTVRKGKVNFSNFKYEFNDVSDPKFMFYSPMYWITGLIFSLAALFTGGSRIVGATFKPNEAWKAIEQNEPDVLFLPPGQLNELHTYAFGKTNSTLKVFLIGGGLVLKSHMDNIKDLFPNSITTNVYGSTENCGMISGINVGDETEVELQKKYPESCGRTCAGLRIRVVNIENEENCGVGIEGEIRMKNIYFMNCYYKMDTKDCFDSDGWFKTGDLGYYNADGMIVILDRIKDILLYTLYNIRPSVIERILSQHPAVSECFVMGFPHPQDNERPMGVVVLKQEYKEKINENELIDYVNEKVPSDRYKIRAGIKFVDNFLKTPTGKTKKLDMKRLIIKGEMW